MRAVSRRALAIGLAAVAALAGLAWVIATQGPLAPVKVTVARAQEGALARSLFGIGTVEARRSYAIGPTAAGRVAKVRVDHGDRVAAGQVLAEMDPVDLEEREAAASAAAQRAENAARAAEAALAEATSRARIVQANAERYEDLRRRQFVSQETADAKRHEADAARAARQSAQAALAAARDDTRRARAERAGSSKARAHLHLASPVAGVVTARLAEPGSTLVAGQPVLQVVDPASVWVKARIDQGRSAGLARGLAAEIALRSRPGGVVRGSVERVDLVGDAVAEERIANVAFDGMPPELTLGELAEVTVHLPTLDRALTIPAAAVKRVDGTEGAWLLQDGRSAFRPIAVGSRSLDGRVQVVSGLDSGEEVIVHSSRALEPQLRVKVVDSLVRGGP